MGCQAVVELRRDAIEGPDSMRPPALSPISPAGLVAGSGELQLAATTSAQHTTTALFRRPRPGGCERGQRVTVIGRVAPPGGSEAREDSHRNSWEPKTPVGQPCWS
jgi:hypothetical protein